LEASDDRILLEGKVCRDNEYSDNSTKITSIFVIILDLKFLHLMLTEKGNRS